MQYPSPISSLTQHDAASLSSFRNMQTTRAHLRKLDQDLHSVQRAVPELGAKIKTKEDQGGVPDRDKLLQALDKITDKLEQIKLQLHSGDKTKRTRVHVPRAHNNEQNEQLTLCLLHMLRRGYFDACDAILVSRGDDNDLPITREDVKLCRDAFGVHKALVETRDPEPAVQWCIDNRWALKRLNSTLEIDLRLQQLLRFVQQDDAVGAVTFAKKHLATHALNHAKVQRGMGTLVFLGMNLDQTPYRDLVGIDGWNTVTNAFREQIFQVLGLREDLNPLRIAVRSGLSVMMTPFCASSSSLPSQTGSGGGGGGGDGSAMEVVQDSHAAADTTSSSSSSILQRGEGCPCCDPILTGLAATVPRVRRERSILTCRISRTRMEDVAVLPNGQAFSRSELERLVVKGTLRGDVIKCPVTGEEFLWKDVRRAYVL